MGMGIDWVRACSRAGCRAPALGAAAGQGPAQKSEAEGPKGVWDTSQVLLEASGELAEELAQEPAPEEGQVFTASFEFTGYSEGAEVPAAAPAPAPGPSGEYFYSTGEYFYSTGPTGAPAEDLGTGLETDSNGEPCESPCWAAAGHLASLSRSSR